MDGAAGHPHAAHATHAAHAPGGHAGGHGGGEERFALPPLRGGPLEDVLGRELVLRVHSHLIHMGEQA